MNDSHLPSDLKRVRRLISSLLLQLEKHARCKTPLGDDAKEHYSRLWGDKDNVVSILVKLTQLLLKIAPPEEAQPPESDDTMLTEEDIAILERFAARRAGQHDAL